MTHNSAGIITLVSMTIPARAVTIHVNGWLRACWVENGELIVVQPPHYSSSTGAVVVSYNRKLILKLMAEKKMGLPEKFQIWLEPKPAYLHNPEQVLKDIEDILT